MFITSTLVPHTPCIDQFPVCPPEDFPHVDFLITGLIFKIVFVSGFLIAVSLLSY